MCTCVQTSGEWSHCFCRRMPKAVCTHDVGQHSAFRKGVTLYGACVSIFENRGNEWKFALLSCTHWFALLRCSNVLNWCTRIDQWCWYGIDWAIFQRFPLHRSGRVSRVSRQAWWMSQCLGCLFTVKLSKRWIVFVWLEIQWQNRSKRSKWLGYTVISDATRRIKELIWLRALFTSHSLPSTRSQCWAALALACVWMVNKRCAYVRVCTHRFFGFVERSSRVILYTKSRQQRQQHRVSNIWESVLKWN